MSPTLDRSNLVVLVVVIDLVALVVVIDRGGVFGDGDRRGGFDGDLGRGYGGVRGGI
jgi:hypothetical protein